MGAEWQPIETAPKEASSVLLSDGARVGQGYWYDIGDTHGWFLDGFDGPDHKPFAATYWMPLPEPPVG